MNSELSSEQYKKWLKEEVDYFNEEFDSYIGVFYDNEGWDAYRQIAFEFLNLKLENPRVLDIGSGPKPSIPNLYLDSKEYICIDPAEKNIENLENFFPEVRAIKGTVEDISSYKLGKFDVIVCFGVLHHVFSPSKSIEMISSHLGQNGYFLSHEPSNYWDGKMGSPNERGFKKDVWQGMIDKEFKFSKLILVNIPVLRKLVYSLLSSLKLWKIVKSVKFWKLIHKLEIKLSYLGFRCSDFLTIASKEK